jgi:hypothetical protein
MLVVCSHDDDENSSLQDEESVRSVDCQRESVIGRPGGIFFRLDDIIFFQLYDNYPSCLRSHPTPSSLQQRSSSFLLASSLLLALSSSSYP